MNKRLATHLAVAALMAASVPSNGQTQYIMPDSVKTVNYKLSVEDDATIRLTMAGHDYRITSRFSTAAPNKWNSFGTQEQENGVDTGWRVNIRKLSNAEYRVSARDSRYKLTRRIKLHPGRVDISDSFSNLSDSTTGIMFEHHLEGNAARPVMRVCGLTDAAAKGPRSRFKIADDGTYRMSSAARPYVQLSQSSFSSLGMIAVDDVFRVQAEMSRKSDGVSISDNHFGLASGAGYTVRWQLYPVETDDHYSFINRVRRAWDTNFPIDGPFGFLRPGVGSDDELQELLKSSGVKIGCYVVASDRIAMEAFGSAYLTEADAKKKQAKQEIERLHRLASGLKAVVYHHGFLDCSKDAEEKFPDCRMMRKDGMQHTFDVYSWEDPPGEKAPYFYPTTTNSFGKMQRELIREELKDTNGGGVYWDEMELNYWSVHPTYMYGVKDWDGHSVEIDPETHQVTQQITNVTLITQPFTQEMVNLLKKHGNTPYCNFMPATRTSTNWRLPRFIEFVDPYYVPEAHLTTPLGLGRGDNETPIIEKVHDFLDMGILYVYSHGVYSRQPSDVVRHIYPITPLEVHEGYVIGKEKTVTNRSGAYGWGDKTFKGSVFIYGSDGKLSGKKGTHLTKDGLAFVRIELDSGEVAVITRNRTPSLRQR